MKMAKFLVSHFDASAEKFRAGEAYPLTDETRLCIARGAAEEVDVARNAPARLPIPTNPQPIEQVPHPHSRGGPCDEPAATEHLAAEPGESAGTEAAAAAASPQTGKSKK